ncbi:hypothetical protein FRC02_008606, partial [Tulasnella sp. 418]
SPEEEARLLTELEELLRRLPASLPDPKTGHQTTYHFGLDPDALEDLRRFLWEENPRYFIRVSHRGSTFTPEDDVDIQAPELADLLGDKPSANRAAGTASAQITIIDNSDDSDVEFVFKLP